MVNYCLVLPYLPGGIELVKKFADSQGTGPDLEVVSMETDDPANTLKEFATSNHPWAVKFREFATKAFGIDFSGPPQPLNENIIDWKQSI